VVEVKATGTVDNFEETDNDKDDTAKPSSETTPASKDLAYELTARRREASNAKLTLTSSCFSLSSPSFSSSREEDDDDDVADMLPVFPEVSLKLPNAKRNLGDRCRRAFETFENKKRASRANRASLGVVIL